jgi:hypothetical protein
VPVDLLFEAIMEFVDRFGAASHETQTIEGRWKHGGVLYRDNLVRIVVDVRDLEANREWMREYKRRWKSRFRQVDLWMVSYPIDVD